MTIETDPLKILQKLVSFDTTNPPGNEVLAINWARDLLAEVGIESLILAKDPNRPNLIARLKGAGKAPPLLLQGHVDVVTTKGQNWTYPPFSGEIHDGYVWGRGTLDMKSGIAMMLTAFLRAHLDKVSLPGDVILCLVADEEAGSTFGARYLIQEHAPVFEGVRFALGEFGGFSQQLLGKCFYPIMVAEKQYCEVQITVQGSGGHGAIVHRNGTMAHLGEILQTLNRHRLPTHITPVFRYMIESIAAQASFPSNLIIRQFLNPLLADRLLGLLGNAERAFEPLFHNTVNATIVRAGEKENVVPAEITLILDGRLLPGFTPDVLLDELHSLLGGEIEIKVLRFNPGPSEPDMRLYPVLADILKKVDPLGNPMPLLLPHVTDAAQFSRLGIQTYGFLPMQLPDNFAFMNAIHAADERITVEALEFGSKAIFEALKRFGEADLT